jgi:hypothetical protein
MLDSPLRERTGAPVVCFLRQLFLQNHAAPALYKRIKDKVFFCFAGLFLFPAQRPFRILHDVFQEIHSIAAGGDRS